MDLRTAGAASSQLNSTVGEPAAPLSAQHVVRERRQPASATLTSLVDDFVHIMETAPVDGADTKGEASQAGHQKIARMPAE